LIHEGGVLGKLASTSTRVGSLGSEFEPSVESAADRLDTFEYPYAYAMWRGVDYRLADVPDAA
jgi:hypothetical protein